MAERHAGKTYPESGLRQIEKMTRPAGQMYPSEIRESAIERDIDEVTDAVKQAIINQLDKAAE